MNIEKPKITVGLTTYNSERYIRVALESLLCQDYQEMEIHVYDNNSTDSTIDILNKYECPYLFVHKNLENIGSSRNFEQAYKNCTTPYFMWAGHDDVWDKSFISKIIYYMERNPEASLCFPNINFIDADDKIINNFKYNNMDTKGMSIAQAFEVLMSDINWYCIYGIFRREALTDVVINLNCPGPDVLILAQLLMTGEIHIIPDFLFTYRIIPKSIYYTAQQLHSGNHTIKKEGDWDFEYTSIFLNIISLVFNSKFTNEIKRELMLIIVSTIIHKNKRWLFQIIKEQNFFDINCNNLNEYLKSSGMRFVFNFVELIFAKNIGAGVFSPDRNIELIDDKFNPFDFLNNISFLSFNCFIAVRDLLIPASERELIDSTFNILEKGDFLNAVKYFKFNSQFFDKTPHLLAIEAEINSISIK